MLVLMAILQGDAGADLGSDTNVCQRLWVSKQGAV